MQFLQKNILWIDALGALIAGLLVLLLSDWLSALYHLPENLITGIGIANICYGTYSSTLAIQSVRSKTKLLLLVSANLVWSVVCLALLLHFYKTATIFGLLHLGIEGVYVGGLAILELKWIELIRKKTPIDII